MKKIKEIKEGNFQYKDKNFEGYIIVLDDDNEIKVGITSRLQCCEISGYLISADNPEMFIGAELIDVSTANKELKSYNINTEKNDDKNLCTMFVNVDTDRGTFQIVAYNQQNGYYGHDAVLLYQDLRHKVTL
jgi:hypothetical protein